MKTVITAALLLWLGTAQAQLFTEQTDIVIQGISRNSVDWGDYNNDGLLDFMMAGKIIGDFYSGLYLNKGNNSFVEHTGIIERGEKTSVDWGDYNNDNYLDIILTGSRFENNTGTIFTEVYRNNKMEDFTSVFGVGIERTHTGSVSWGDYDNDGFNDILQSGQNSPGDFLAKVYHNNKNESFSSQTGIYIDGTWYGSVAWGDYNNDGYLDFIYTGNSIDNEIISKIYKNTGNGVFISQDDISIIGVVAGSSEWGDYNNDGYLDLVVSGQIGGGINVSEIYRNNQDGTFTKLSNVYLINVSWSCTKWGDFDNDGLYDVLLTGSDISISAHTEIYKNMGHDIFTEQSNSSLDGVRDGQSAWGDYDNDNDLDILLTGFNGTTYVSKLYRNNTPTPNSPPNVIKNLETQISGDTVFFSWDEATDDNQPSPGLNYNMYVYEADNPLPYVDSPEAFPYGHPMCGKRLTAQRGHIQGIRENGRVTYFLIGVFQNCKTYYWSVQAVDASFAGGKFPPEASFVFDDVTAQENLNNTFQIYPNPTTGIVTVNFAKVLNIGKVEIQITDITGKEVYKNQYPAITKLLKIDLSAYPPGLYFLKISNANFTGTQKLIIR